VNIAVTGFGEHWRWSSQCTN